MMHAALASDDASHHPVSASPTQAQQMFHEHAPVSSSEQGQDSIVATATMFEDAQRFLALLERES